MRAIIKMLQLNISLKEPAHFVYGCIESKHGAVRLSTFDVPSLVHEMFGCSTPYNGIMAPEPQPKWDFDVIIFGIPWADCLHPNV